jgi:hypothetical protein
MARSVIIPGPETSWALKNSPAMEDEKILIIKTYCRLTLNLLR